MTDVHTIIEDCGAAVMARLLGWDGSLVTQATVSSIAYQVFDLDAALLQTAAGALVVADTVYDTEQTGGGWPYSDGFNFRAVLPASAFPTGGHQYQVEVVFTPVAGEVFAIRRVIVTETLYGS